MNLIWTANLLQMIIGWIGTWTGALMNFIAMRIRRILFLQNIRHLATRLKNNPTPPTVGRGFSLISHFMPRIFPIKNNPQIIGLIFFGKYVTVISDEFLNGETKIWKRFRKSVREGS